MDTLGLVMTIGGAVAGSFVSAVHSSTTSINKLSQKVKRLNEIKIKAENLRELQRSGQKASKDIASLSRELKKAGINTRNLDSEIQKLNKQISRLEKHKQIKIKLQADQQKLKDELMGTVSSAVGLSVLTYSIKVAANFENAMNEVKVLSGATKKEFEMMKTKAKELGATTKFSASEVAAGMKYLTMAGFSASQQIKTIEPMLNLAAVANIDLARASDVASDLLGSFGMQAEDTGRMVDVLAKTITTSNSTVETLYESMKFSAPVAKQFGIEIEDLAALTGLLANAGIKGSMAGTTLRFALNRLADPTKEAQKALQNLNVSVTDQAGNMRPLPNILADIASATKNMGNAQKSAYISAIFGVSAMSGMSVLLDQGADKIKKYTKTLRQSSGFAKSAAKDMQKPLEGQLTALQSALEAVMISAGSSFLPIVTKFVTILAKGLSLVAKLNEKTHLVSIIAGFVGLFSVVKILFVATKLLGTSIRSLWTDLKILKDSFGSVLSKMRGFFSSFSQNIGSISNAIKSKISSIATSFSNLNLSAKLNALKTSFLNFATSVKTSIASAFSSATTAVKSFILSLYSYAKSAVVSAITATKTFAISLWQSAKKAVISAATSMSAYISSIFTYVATAIPAAISATASFTSAIIANTAAFLANPIGLIIAGIIALGTAIYFTIKKWDKIKDFFSSLIKKIQPIINFISKIFKNAFSPIVNLFKNIISKITSLVSIANPFKSLQNKISSVFSKSFSYVKNIISNSFSSIKNSFSALTSKLNPGKLITPFKNAFSKIKNFSSNMINSISFKSLQNKISSVFSFFKSIAKKTFSFISKLLNPVKSVFSTIKGLFSSNKDAKQTNTKPQNKPSINTISSKTITQKSITQKSYKSSVEKTKKYSKKESIITKKSYKSSVEKTKKYTQYDPAKAITPQPIPKKHTQNFYFSINLNINTTNENIQDTKSLINKIKEELIPEIKNMLSNMNQKKDLFYDDELGFV